MFMNAPNINIIIIIGILYFTNTTCKKEPVENFPYASVSISVNLTAYPIGIGTAIICPNGSNIGALGKGILIYNADGTNYMAFSMLCTNYPNDTAAVALEPSGDIADCPRCKSKFLFSQSGCSILKGPAKYPLKEYSCTLSSDGTSLLIQN